MNPPPVLRARTVLLIEDDPAERDTLRRFLEAHGATVSVASDGLDVGSHQVATAINSFVLFCFFSVVPLLSLISGWLFFAFDPNDAAKALRQRIGRRFTSLYMPLVFWNGLFLAALFELHRLAPSHPLLAEINVDFSTAGLRQYVNAVFGLTKHPVGFQFWFVRDLFVTATPPENETNGRLRRGGRIRA